MDSKDLEVILNATIKLTVIKLKNCLHLEIGNFSAEVFTKLLMAYKDSEAEIIRSELTTHKRG